jgi:molybdopterin converting factor small subunit
MITIEIPRALVGRIDADDVIFLDATCETVGGALAELGVRSPALLDRIVDEQGEVRQHVNIFLDQTSIRSLDGLSTPLREGSTLYLLASVSGG